MKKYTVKYRQTNSGELIPLLQTSNYSIAEYFIRKFAKKIALGLNTFEQKEATRIIIFDGDTEMVNHGIMGGIQNPQSLTFTKIPDKVTLEKFSRFF